jgi:hypothetical protein
MRYALFPFTTLWRSIGSTPNPGFEKVRRIGRNTGVIRLFTIRLSHIFQITLHPGSSEMCDGALSVFHKLNASIAQKEDGF